MRLSRPVFVKLSLEGDDNPSFFFLRADFNIRGTTGSFGVPAEKDEKKPEVNFLDSFALERWEVSYFAYERFALMNSVHRQFFITWCLPAQINSRRNPLKAFYSSSNAVV